MKAKLQNRRYGVIAQFFGTTIRFESDRRSGGSKHWPIGRSVSDGDRPFRINAFVESDLLKRQVFFGVEQRAFDITGHCTVSNHEAVRDDMIDGDVRSSKCGLDTALERTGDDGDGDAGSAEVGNQIRRPRAQFTPIECGIDPLFGHSFKHRGSLPERALEGRFIAEALLHKSADLTGHVILSTQKSQKIGLGKGPVEIEGDEGHTAPFGCHLYTFAHPFSDGENRGIAVDRNN